MRKIFLAVLAAAIFSAQALAQLSVSQLTGFNVGEGKQALVLTYQGQVDLGSGLTTGTYTNAPIGTAPTAPNRRFVIAVNYVVRGSGSTSYTSHTIAGSASTVLLKRDGTLGGLIAIHILEVPTGTTATLSSTWNATSDANGVACWTLVTGPDGYTVLDTETITTSSSTTIAVAAGGAVLGAAGTANGSAQTWTGLTSRFSDDINTSEWTSGASDNFASANSALTIQATSSGTGFAYLGLSLAP